MKNLDKMRSRKKGERGVTESCKESFEEKDKKFRRRERWRGGLEGALFYTILPGVGYLYSSSGQINTVQTSYVFLGVSSGVGRRGRATAKQLEEWRGGGDGTWHSC